MEKQPKYLVVFQTIYLLKPNRHIDNGLEEYPEMPTLIANRSTAQLFPSVIDLSKWGIFI